MNTEKVKPSSGPNFFPAMQLRFNSPSNLTPNLLASNRLFYKWLLCHWSAGNNDSETSPLVSVMPAEAITAGRRKPELDSA